MIQLDDFYINYKLIVEGKIKKLISNSLTEAKDYADTVSAVIFNDRGVWNASGDTFPSTGGSGASGAIKKGDLWTVIVGGEPDNLMLESGDMIRAFVDNPGQIQSDWILIENQYNYIPFDKEGDTLTGTNGSGFIGLQKQTTDPTAPTNGIKLFANNDGKLTFINENNEVIILEDIISLLDKHINGILMVDMLNDNKTLTSEESKNSIFVLTNVGDGSKTLTLFDSIENAKHITFYVFDNNSVNVSLSNGSLIKSVKQLSPLQIIYTPTISHSLNYVTFDNLMTPGWATKVHFNEFGLVDNTATITTADVNDSTNKRYITDAERQFIQDLISNGGGGGSSGGANVWADENPPTNPTIYPLWYDSFNLTLNLWYENTPGNFVWLEIANANVQTKESLGLGNVDNTSDINKPISTATQNALNNKEDKSNKGQPNGYAPLNNLGKIPSNFIDGGVSSSGIYQQFYEITAIDISNKYITLDYTPIDNNKVDIIVYGGIHQRSNVDFLVSGNQVSWDGLAMESLLEQNNYICITYSH